MTLTVGSLFSGIGGIDLGLERAGMRVVWQVESDEYARRVLAKHWPDVPCWPDVRTVHYHRQGQRCPGCLASVDVLCGGFPCQDISTAGRRAGIDGPRSGLWTEFHRLVCELRPRYVLVENVAALLSGGMGHVLGNLAASGYDAQWDCLPASAIGAHHQRDRLFILAHAAGQPDDVPPRAREDVPAPPRPRAGWPAPRSSAWAPLPDMDRVADGVPDRVDRLRCLGNAVVPRVAEHVGRLILEHARGAA